LQICCNPSTPTERGRDAINTCTFLFRNFVSPDLKAADFPRKVSTKTTEGRQILVNDKPQALARFKQANWLDCRISAYTELDDSPNFLFVDIDIKNDIEFVAMVDVDYTGNKNNDFVILAQKLENELQLGT
jgi:hypothetical protein